MESPTVTNNNTTVILNYNSDTDANNRSNDATVGSIENLPAGTTQQDVENALTNGFTLALVELMREKLESDPNMDPEMQEYLLGQIDSLTEENLIDVDPEVQAAVDAEHGETNTELAQSLMDLLMEQFEETANDERMSEARNVDSDEGSSEGVGPGNWFIQLAKALAEIQSKWLDNLMDAYQRMQDNTTAAPGEGATDEEREAHADNQKAFIQAQAEVTAYARLFGMASETTSNVIKSIGDRLTSVARKQ